MMRAPTKKKLLKMILKHRETVENLGLRVSRSANKTKGSNNVVSISSLLKTSQHD